MESVESGISTAGDIFGGLWQFALDNPIIMIIFVISLVGVGIGLFMRLKSRLSRRK